TDRKRARLKYVLDRMGLERFLAEVEKRLAAPLVRLPLADCEPRPPLARGAHVGFHAQKQPGRVYCGVALPVGRMTTAQMRAIADHLDARLKVDAPLNIHLTGCPNSCAQHHVGDIGLLATKVAADSAEVEGYHLFAGGGFGDRRGLGREILRDIPADEAPHAI